MAADGELMAYLHDGFWHPMDNSRDYQHLNGLWNNQEAPWACWQEPPQRAVDAACRCVNVNDGEPLRIATDEPFQLDRKL